MTSVLVSPATATLTGHDFIRTQAKRIGRNLLMRGLAFLVLAAGLFALVAPEVLTQRDDALPKVAVLANGPTPSLTRAGQLFTVQVGEYLDPSVSTTLTSTSSTVHYRFLRVDEADDRYLMVASNKALKKGQVIRGGLRSINTPVIRQAITIATEIEPRLEGRVLPMYVDTGASAALGGLTVIFIVALGFSLAGLIGVLKGSLSIARPQRSLLSRKLRRARATEAFGQQRLLYGSGQPPIANVAVTEEFAVLARVFRADVFAVKDLIWVHAVWNRGRSDMRCYLRSGKKIGKSFGVSKASPTNRGLALAALAKAASSAHLGFSAKQAKQWKKQRAQMIAEVDQGRR
jgi:hypothetical protein